MKDHFTKEKIQYNAPVWACILFILFLFFLPTGYQEIYREADQCVAKVLETDDSAIIDTGLVRSGEQRCKLEIISGKFKGEQTEGVNMLNGSLEQDKMFYPGDTAQVVVSYDGDEILMVTMIDHNRIPMELVMGAIFIIFLILFAGRTGIRAVLSFLLTILALWKILVPSYLKGYNPIWMGLIFTLILSLLIIALVYGFDRRCAANPETAPRTHRLRDDSDLRGAHAARRMVGTAHVAPRQIAGIRSAKAHPAAGKRTRRHAAQGGTPAHDLFPPAQQPFHRAGCFCAGDKLD